MRKGEPVKGYYIELLNRSTSRVVFSAATSDLSEQEFTRLWTTVGNNIYRQQTSGDRDRWNQFELRISPITDS